MNGNGTDAWVIVAAAFGGGLAGAILQPLLTFGLDRLRSKDRRRKTIEQRLRYMVTRWLDYLQRAGRTAVEVASRRELNRPPLSPEGIAALLRFKEHEFPTWQAQRIKDSDMRVLADQLYTLSNAIYFDLANPETTMEVLDAKIEEVADLSAKLTIKMDELDWPEFEISQPP